MVRHTFPSINSFGLGTALVALLLAGSLNIAASTRAHAESQSPEACIQACKTEKEKCLSQMGTAEMCGADQKVCEKACEKK